jgi:hypothetical protein
MSDNTGVSQTTTTDSAGGWMVQYLIPGHYHFKVSAPGFKTTDRTSIELQVGDRKFVDVMLQVGGEVETVTVQATTPLIDTSAAVSGTVVTTKQLEELPSQSNSPTLLAGLTPGVIVGNSTGTAAHLWSNISASALTVNGVSSTRGINYQLDGGTDANQAGQVSFIPPMDAVGEFRVTTDAYDASIGRQTGATINMQFKSGAEKFHGSLYEYNQNNTLNARTYNGARAAVHYNEYGGTVGGPVWIPKLYDGRLKKTFFFYNFDGIHNNAPGNSGTMSLPNTMEKQGDFSHSFTTVTTGTGASAVTTVYPVRIYDPSTYNAATGLRSEFAGNNCNVAPVVVKGGIAKGTDPNGYLPQRTCRIPNPDPIAIAIGKMIPDVSPTANDGVSSDSNNFIKNEVYYDRFTSNALRIDQNWTNSQHSYVTLRSNKWTELGYDPFGTNNLLQGLNQARNSKGVTIDHTWMISSKDLLDLRFNVQRYEGSAKNLGAGVSPKSLGFSDTYIGHQTLPSIPYLTGLVNGAENGGLGTNQSGPTNDTTWEYIVNATRQLQAHTLRYGFQFLNQQEGTTGYGQSGGSFGFDTSWTRQNPTGNAGTGEGLAYASFMLGLPTSGSLPTNASAFWDQHYTAFYLQDDWRVTSKLTLNLGLRWDYERPIEERDDRMWARYDPTFNQTQITVVAQSAYAKIVSGSTTNSGVAVLQQYRPDASTFVAKGAYLYAGVNGNPKSILNTRYKYLQPRLGFAYRIYPNAVIRGGLGRFVQGNFDTGVSAQQYGYSVSTSIASSTDNFRHIAPGFSFSNPYPNGINSPIGNSLGTLTNPGGVTGFRDPNYGRPYTDTASLSLQQEVKRYLIEVGGTLNFTHGLSVSDPLNNNSNGFQSNQAVQAAWVADNTPTFTNGRPDDTLPGNQTVPNPFYHAPYITNGTQNNATVAVSQLLRPNPMSGNIIDDAAKGKLYYYALNTKVERRFVDGFSVLQSFTWSKAISENNFIGPQGYAEVVERRLSSTDAKFHYTVTPLYVLPFGRGQRFGNQVNRAMEQLIGGWELTGVYNFQSGNPVILPTNTAFFQGGDPIQNTSGGHTGKWLNVNAFAPYPTRSTPASTVQSYPSWTGIQNMPGASWVPTGNDATKNGVYQDFAARVTYNQTTFGNIRQPWLTDFTLGVRKNFKITESMRAELRIDAFNALNHPRFGNIGTDPNSAYFGQLSGSSVLSAVNNPRQIQLSGKFFF